MMRAHRGDKGATLVEYALAVALILVICIAAINRLQTGEQSELTARANGIGKPNENTAIRGGTGGSGGSGGSGGGGGSTTNISNPPALTGTSGLDNGNKWLANITVKVLDDSGNPVAGATVNGDWNPDTNSETATCTTSSAGTCVLTIAKLSSSTTTVNYMLTSVTGNATLNVNYSGGTPSLSISQPNPCC